MTFGESFSTRPFNPDRIRDDIVKKAVLEYFQHNPNNEVTLEEIVDIVKNGIGLFKEDEIDYKYLTQTRQLLESDSKEKQKEIIIEQLESCCNVISQESNPQLIKVTKDSPVAGTTIITYKPNPYYEVANTKPENVALH